jgi:hypothetical protein
MAKILPFGEGRVILSKQHSEGLGAATKDCHSEERSDEESVL